jgi:1-acyl-sn-glycerol-3-phosphate acyltransferase
MSATFLATLARIISGANVRWIGCQPDARQRIYFANHTSHLDALVLWAVLPGDVRALVRPVAARDYWWASRSRRYLAEQVFHAVLIERKKVTAQDNPIEKMVQAMARGHSLIIFPEGGRGDGTAVGEFKSGLYHLLRRKPDAELIPVHIDNLNRILPKGEVLPVPLLSCISFGAPLRAVDSETKAEFLDRARRAVVELAQT